MVHDDIPKSKWELAVVTDLQRGCDDAVRSATICTANGKPIVKLYPLEVNAETELTVQQSQEDTDNRSPTECGTLFQSQLFEWARILGGPEDVVD